MAITMLAGYLVIINAAALLMMAEDKRRAKRHQWRVPEAALFGAALLGGSAGAWAGMYLFHHKKSERSAGAITVPQHRDPGRAFDFLG